MFNQEKILNLKNKHFSKDLVSLESCFGRNNVIKAETTKEEQSLRKVQETKKVNIGTTKDPKLLNLGITCSKEETMLYIDLFEEFYDVFAWLYHDLKEYDNEMFQHVSPLKEGAIPVRQNSKFMNPKLNPLLKLELEKWKRME